MKTDNPTGKKRRATNRYWVEIKGRLYARYQYKTETGGYKVKYQPITDKRTARAVVEKMRRELETHGEELFSSEKMTFDELVDKFEKVELVAAGFQNGVKIRGRRSVGPVRSAIKPLRAYFGRKPIRSIKPADIKSFKDARLDTPVEMTVNEKEKIVDERTGKTETIIRKVVSSRERKVASVNRELTVLRTILNFAVSNDWLILNPFAKTKGIISTAAEVERERVLSFDEEQRLLDACTGERAHLRPILICALDTAMRRGELLKMRWSDVDLARNRIVIPQTNTKTEESRIVGVTPRMGRELVSLWEASPMDQDRTVFGISHTIKTAFKSACDAAGIVDFRFHDCRHTATTRMIAAGCAHTEVMKITGHSQLKTFLRYLNITTETANKVALKLAEYQSGGRALAVAVASESVS